MAALVPALRPGGLTDENGGRSDRRRRVAVLGGTDLDALARRDVGQLRGTELGDVSRCSDVDGGRALPSRDRHCAT